MRRLLIWCRIRYVYEFREGAMFCVGLKGEASIYIHVNVHITNDYVDIEVIHKV